MMGNAAGRWTLGRIATGVMRRVGRFLPRSPRPAILMYHRVARETFDPWGLCVTEERFADQLAWLSRHRTILPLTEFARRHRDGALPDTAVAITFDDGYACVATAAAPLLREAGVPATVFLPAELIERGHPFWWDELERLVLGTDRSSITLGEEVVALGEKSPADVDWRPGARPATPRQAAFHGIWAILRPLPTAQIESVMAKLREEAELPDTPVSTKRPMSPQQVRELAKGGIEFGSHALTHPWLESLGPDEKAREIEGSVKRCAQLIGARPESFAYPYGNFDPESERLVQAAGFTCACATEGRPVAPASRPFALPRIAVGNWSGPQLGRALAAAI